MNLSVVFAWKISCLELIGAGVACRRWNLNVFIQLSWEEIISSPFCHTSAFFMARIHLILDFLFCYIFLGWLWRYLLSLNSYLQLTVLFLHGRSTLPLKLCVLIGCWRRPISATWNYSNFHIVVHQLMPTAAECCSHRCLPTATMRKKGCNDVGDAFCRHPSQIYIYKAASINSWFPTKC